MQTFQVTISAIKQETPTIKSFRLDYGEQKFSFLPGQWIDLFIEIDGKAAVGGYSMTSSPLQQGSLELAIKQGIQHPVTRYLHEQAKIGDTVTISNGQGVFIYQREMADHIVLVGAGVGVTPLMSILRYCNDAAPEVEATLVYSIPTPAEFLFRNELNAMTKANANIRCLVTATQSNSADWKGLTGRIDPPLLRSASRGADELYYLCGPQMMIESVVTDLKNMGIPDSRIIFEKWW